MKTLRSHAPLLSKRSGTGHIAVIPVGSSCSCASSSIFLRSRHLFSNMPKLTFGWQLASDIGHLVSSDIWQLSVKALSACIATDTAFVLELVRVWAKRSWLKSTLSLRDNDLQCSTAKTGQFGSQCRQANAAYLSKTQ